MGVVRGVLLDESILLVDDGSGSLGLKPGVEAVLRRLRYSGLRVGFCHADDVGGEKVRYTTFVGLIDGEFYYIHQGYRKVTFLQDTARAYSFSCIPLNVQDAFNHLLLDWGTAGDSYFYVTSRNHVEVAYEILDRNWVIVCVDFDSTSAVNEKTLSIKMLEELLITICSFSKKNFPGVIVGYVMKPSREEDFAKRGAFPIHPTQNGLMFVPLTFEIPLELQLQKVDAVLHKATDEIIRFSPHISAQFSQGILFSNGILELERFITDHPECCIIDPLKNLYPLLDRYSIQRLLLGLQELNMKDHCKLRAPYFLKIDNFNEPNLRDQLSEANLSFPIIVKPQIACGVGDAHNMALVFKFEDIKDLHVPVPAVLQVNKKKLTRSDQLIIFKEYVDHGSLIYKFYVLGTNVFHAVKKSMPNASYLMSLTERSGFKPITFDSLKSLPVATDDQISAGRMKSHNKSLNVDLVNDAARWLKTKLDLTIFGFDVVIQEDSGDHVIVDLNYLPSFKEVPDADAIPAFWTAIKNAYESRKPN